MTDYEKWERASRKREAKRLAIMLVITLPIIWLTAYAILELMLALANALSRQS